MNRNIKILDCTVRDGGYINNWNFNDKVVREIYRAVSKAGMDIMEIGFRGTEKYFDKEMFGQWRFSDEKNIKETVKGIEGASLALMADFGKISVDDFIDSNNSIIDLVRIAAHKDNIPDAIKLLERIKGKGYKVSLNAMGYTSFTAEEQKNMISQLKNSNLDYIYAVDSYGSLFPNQVKAILEPLLEIEGIKVGFHPHNSLQMAFANTLEAINCGVHIVDSTLYGMGRGAGNLPTEIIVLYLELMGNKKYNVIPILNCIDTYFLPLKKEFEWGYQLPFMLSGMYRCHSSYAKELVEYREYTVEEMCKTMEHIKKVNPIGYSSSLVKELIEGGVIGKIKSNYNEEGKSTKTQKNIAVPYLDRHKGKDFLILANGPTVKEEKEKIDRLVKITNPIILGANNLSGLYEPHYHGFNNKKRFMMYIDTVSVRSKLLLSQHFSKKMIKEYTSRDFDLLFYEDLLNQKFDIKNGVIQANCRTISVLLVGIAIVMGAKRIFIAGMDGYLNYDSKGKILYYEEKDEKTDRQMIIERHKWCQKFFEDIDEYLLKNGHEGIHIVTPTTYKAFYKGIDNYL